MPLPEQIKKKLNLILFNSYQVWFVLYLISSLISFLKFRPICQLKQYITLTTIFFTFNYRLLEEALNFLFWQM